MTLFGEPRKVPKRRMVLKTAVRRVLKFAGWGLLAIAVAVCLVVWTGLGDRWARRAIVGRLEQMTGGRAELAKFHFQPLRLRAELTGLTLHGREPENTPPFFHADSLFLDIRVDSFFRRKISLNEVRLDRPAVHVRVEADGRSNVPIPKSNAPPSQPWQERLFEIAIRQLRLNDGYILFNDVRVPLAAEGGQFRFALDYNSGVGAAPGKPFYLGQLSWQQMLLAARRYIPFASDLNVKFTLERDAFALNQLRWKLPQSDFDVEASLASFTRPDWHFRYRGRLALADARSILRKPNTPGGVVEFTGEGGYAREQVSVRGHYAVREIEMPYQWFHTSGISSRGSYHADRRNLEVPDFEAQVLGGTVQGRVSLEFSGLKFRAETHSRGVGLAGILAAVNNPSFPVGTLHWNAGVDVSDVSTWTEDFKHVESRGLSLWAPPMEPRPGEIPASARLAYHYVMDQSAVFISERLADLAERPSEISTPTSHLELSGVLGARDSALDVTLDAQDLEPWDDFINRLRGRDAEAKRITGRAHWQGRVEGPIGGPTFIGHVKTLETAYGRLYWDEVEGDLVFSPEQFRLLRTRARHGRSSAHLELALELENWGFSPGKQWSLEADLDRAETDDLQELFGWSYPVRGLLSGTFRGRGTRADPELAGLFEVAEPEAWGYRMNHVRGQLSVRRGEIRISNVELRTFVGTAPPPAGTNDARRTGPGLLTGNFLYRMRDQEIAFDLTGAVIPLEGIERIQTARLPLGGQLSFQLRGQGSLFKPTAEGTLRLVDLRVGKEVLGSFEGKLNSDGDTVRVELDSAIIAGRLHGRLAVTLAGDYPLAGDVAVEGMDLDPFIQNALHLGALTGHSSVNGRFLLSGALRRPETLAVDADISRLLFDFEYVKLENAGPLRLRYRRDEVRIEQAKLRGPDTDFSISGFARFAGDRRLGLNLAGTVNLRLAGGFVPGLEARGPAQVNAAIEGTSSSPRITGKVRLENVAANFGDFPAGLSQMNGDFVFDSSRLLFENVSAETGGGRLLLGGSLSYGEGPLRYDIIAQTARVRIRYPEGMSWLVGGTLRLSGTTQAGLLSGRVVVERLLMAQGFDLAALIVASKEPVRAPSTTSSYLRNLQFDIEAVSGPDARMEWTGARLETEANLRLRGTWEHPILLGHIHLLTGEMTFRGNRYRLSRGDINFANPFRLDPVLNVEATTTIRQYEVTLNFTGPASRLTLVYRSDPPLPSTDILALLALGRTGGESELRGSTGAQTPESGASTLLSEAISSQLGGRIERLFGISRFRVDPFLAGAGAGSESNAAARITIEQQITRDLVITYITNVTSTQQQVIQVEYSVNRDISIVALRDQNGTFGLDVKFKKRFK
jgi:translocation and assembly module TamB